MSIALIHENPNKKTTQIYDPELGVFVLASEDGTPHQRLSMCEHAVNVAYAEFRRIYGMERTRELAKTGLVEAVKAANAHNYELMQKAKSISEKRKLTTQEKESKPIVLNNVSLDIGIILGDDLYFAHVGSNGIYRFKEDRLVKLSEDHIIDGTNGDILTQGIGIRETIEGQKKKVTLNSTDYLLICNHEFCQTMGEERIRRSLYKTFEPIDEIARNIKNEAISFGCKSICGLLYKHDRK